MAEYAASAGSLMGYFAKSATLVHYYAKNTETWQNTAQVWQAMAEYGASAAGRGGIPRKCGDDNRERSGFTRSATGLRNL